MMQILGPLSFFPTWLNDAIFVFFFMGLLAVAVTLFASAWFTKIDQWLTSRRVLVGIVVR